MQVVEEILVDTDDQVPADSIRPVIGPLQQLISPIPTLQLSPKRSPLIAPAEMPTDLMEHEDVAKEKQPERAGDAEMQEAPEAEAEAEAKVEYESEEEESEDMTTHYFHVTESQSHYEENWLTVLWSYQDHEQPLRYRLEVLKYWEKVNASA